jgi:hypothetical protein
MESYKTKIKKYEDKVKLIERFKDLMSMSDEDLRIHNSERTNPYVLHLRIKDGDEEYNTYHLNPSKGVGYYSSQGIRKRMKRFYKHCVEDLLNKEWPGVNIVRKEGNGIDRIYNTLIERDALETAKKIGLIEHDAEDELLSIGSINGMAAAYRECLNTQYIEDESSENPSKYYVPLEKRLKIEAEERKKHTHEVTPEEWERKKLELGLGAGKNFYEETPNSLVQRIKQYFKRN